MEGVLILFHTEFCLSFLNAHLKWFFLSCLNVDFFFKGARSALALKDEFGDSETFQQNLQTLLMWVCEIEELTANQKPPSSEFKVVKAQLQEQKVCSKLWLQHSAKETPPLPWEWFVFMNFPTRTDLHINVKSTMKTPFPGNCTGVKEWITKVHAHGAPMSAFVYSSWREVIHLSVQNSCLC